MVNSSQDEEPRHVRSLRSREIAITLAQVPRVQHHHAASAASQGSRSKASSGGSAHSGGVAHSRGGGSLRSEAGRSHRSHQLQVELEELEANQKYEQLLHDLQRKEEELKRQQAAEELKRQQAAEELKRQQAAEELKRQQAAEELQRQQAAEEFQRQQAELKRQLAELQRQREIEDARRRLSRVENQSASGSQVSRPHTPLSAREQSSRLRTASWVEKTCAIPRQAPNFLPPSINSNMAPQPIGEDFRGNPFLRPELPISRPLENVSHSKLQSQEPALGGWDTYLSRKTAGKDLPSFSGDPTEWLSFISAYHRTTKIGQFSEEENMLRLSKALRGRARESVLSLLAVPNASHEILRVLEIQFGRPTIIINTLIDKVKRFSRLSDDNTQSIIDFSIKVNNLIVAIECLKQERYLTNPQLLDEVVMKLSPSLRLQWGEFLAIQLKGEGDLRDFKKWLNDKAAGAACVTVPNFKPLCRSENRQISVVNEQSQGPNQKMLKPLVCFYCQSNHSIRKCDVFKSLSVEDRRDWVKQSKLCFSCLSRTDHRAEKCRKSRKCGINGCQAKHHQLLHSDLDDCKNKSDNRVAVHNFITSSKVLLKILPVRVRGPLGEVVVPALLDEGADCSLIDSELADKLGLSGHKLPLCIQWIQGVSREDRDSKSVDLSISRPSSNKFYHLKSVRTVRNLCLPYQSVSKVELCQVWPEVSHIPLEFNSEIPRLLIGQDNWSLIESLKCIRREWNGLALSKTRLGWVLHGRYLPENLPLDVDHKFHTCVVESSDEALHQLVKDHFSLDFLGSHGKEHSLSHDEQLAVSILNNTAKFVNGRWTVGLIWNSDEPYHVDSFGMALQRLRCVERKLSKDASFADQYRKKMEDYVSKGYARKLSLEELKDKPKRTWYLPHLAVFNPNKPGKIRVVFDASAKVNGVSLNSQLLKGPDLYISIPSILLGFRKGKIGFGGDIREMFLQIKIRKEDQMAQRYLWRTNPEDKIPDTYIMESMLFGAICSPFTAQEIRNRNASRFKGSHPRAVEAIHRAHYMDDYLDSADTEDEAVALIKDVYTIHLSGGLEMVNWISNSPHVTEKTNSMLSGNSTKLLDSSHTQKVLGLRWDTVTDVFVFQFNRNRIPTDILDRKRSPTKREFLKIIMSIYDPLGFLGWFLINAKILLQDIWRSATGWDEQINDSLLPQWIEWLRYLDKISTIEIPRCYTPLIPSATRVELHIFCDASDRAYAALGYMRVISDGKTEVSFIASKSRVAPLKQVSIPRLELQAAVLGSRLAKILREGCRVSFNREYFWSDSRTVLHWIRHSELRYRMFVAHRLREILETTDPLNWRWLPGKENPADDSTKSKGFMPDRWLTGPNFLRHGEDKWPQTGDCSNGSDSTELLVQVNVVASLSRLGESLPDISRFSSFIRLIRSTAWLLRFIKQCQKVKNNYSPYLTSVELRCAEEVWWKKMQADDFAREIQDLQQSGCVQKDSRLYRLSPFIDTNGVLRVQGRIQNLPTIPEDTKQPVILDPRNRFVELLIDNYHLKACHQGQEYVANEIRQRYWVLGLRRAVRRAWNRCLTCAKERAKPYEQPMAPLPPDRLNVGSRPFSSTGLDYFGPFQVTVRRAKEKRYGAIFSCLTTRAVHLELVTDLTTDGTLLAIRRMASRRGCPSRIWSDNGTNFRGTARIIRECLRKLDQRAIGEEMANKNIEWHFIPPAAPHMGGSWERLIRSIKKAFMTIMKSQAPREDVMLTLFAEAEHLINSRPITVVSDDPSDPEALTPNHFLIGCSSGLVPTIGCSNETLNLQRRWHSAQTLSNQFWHRWLREYLPGLVKRTKWFGKGQQINIGQLVYLADPQRKRTEWSPGRIVKTYPGRDGFTRVVDVKTRDGILRRPITSLLPIFPNEE